MRVHQLTRREIDRLPMRDVCYLFALGRLPRRSAARVRITRMGETLGVLVRRYEGQGAGTGPATNEGEHVRSYRTPSGIMVTADGTTVMATQPAGLVNLGTCQRFATSRGPVWRTVNGAPVPHDYGAELELAYQSAEAEWASPRASRMR